MTFSEHALTCALEAVVPLQILLMRDWTPAQRVNEAYFASGVIAEKGDVLQYGGRHYIRRPSLVRRACGMRPRGRAVMTPAETQVKHGYTLGDLHQMTAAALMADRSMAMDYAERRDIAWSAIAEALCAAPHWPKRSELIQAGLQAIYRAVHEDYRLAAQALDIKDSTYRRRISTARQQILAQLLQDETPRKVSSKDRRVGVRGKELASHCSNRHEWTPENTRIRYRIMRGKRHASRVCRACEHDRSVAREAREASR